MQIKGCNGQVSGCVASQKSSQKRAGHEGVLEMVLSVATAMFSTAPSENPDIAMLLRFYTRAQGNIREHI